MGRRCLLALMQISLIYISILYLLNPDHKWLQMLLFKNGTIIDLINNNDDNPPIKHIDLKYIEKLFQSINQIISSNKTLNQSSTSSLLPLSINSSLSIESSSPTTSDDNDNQSWYRTCCYIMIIINLFGLIAILCKLWICLLMYLIPIIIYFCIIIIQFITTKNMMYIIDIIIFFMIIWECLMILLMECADSICDLFISSFRSFCHCCCSCCCCSCCQCCNNDDNNNEQPIMMMSQLNIEPQQQKQQIFI